MSGAEAIVEDLKAMAPGGSVTMSQGQLELLCSRNVIQPVPISQEPYGNSSGQLPQTVYSTDEGMPNGESKIIHVMQDLPSQISLPPSTSNQAPIRNGEDIFRGDSLVASTIRKFATEDEWEVVRKVMERSASKSGVVSLSIQECPREASGASESHFRKRDGPKSPKFKIPLPQTMPSTQFVQGNRKSAKKTKKSSRKTKKPSRDDKYSSSSSNSSSSTDSSSSEEDTKSVARAKDENWPHPLAKLIGQEGSTNNYATLSGNERETITHNREFVRERTRNLKSASFPTQRVGWHNSLLTIQLSQALDILQESALSKPKHETRHIILDLEYQNEMPIIDLGLAKKWIKEARASNNLMLKLISDSLEAVQHECKIAKIVEKDGFQTVSKLQSSPDFEPEFKKHLDYVRKESVKATVGLSKTSTIPSKGSRNRGSLFRGRASGNRHYGQPNYVGNLGLGNHGGYATPSNLRTLPGGVPVGNNGPSAKRPCAICKGIDHWVESCPRK